MVYLWPVPAPPTIRGMDSDLPDEVTVLINKTTQLDCHVDGNPTPKITWFKDSQPISSSGPHRILSNGRALQVTGSSQIRATTFDLHPICIYIIKPLGKYCNSEYPVP